MKHIRFWLLLPLFMLLSSVVQAASWSGWPQTGQAKLTWGFFDVYNSRLRTPSGHYKPGQWPQVLTIEYLRSIDRQELAKAAAEQWQALGYQDEADKYHWVSQLENILPDVVKGSRISFLADDRGGQFYSQAPGSEDTSPIGPRFDSRFRDAFLAIWLSPNTQYPTLRNDLIGIR